MRRFSVFPQSAGRTLRVDDGFQFRQSWSVGRNVPLVLVRFQIVSGSEQRRKYPCQTFADAKSHIPFQSGIEGCGLTGDGLNTQVHQEGDKDDTDPDDGKTDYPIPLGRIQDRQFVFVLRQFRWRCRFFRFLRPSFLLSRHGTTLRGSGGELSGEIRLLYERSAWGR